MRVSYRLSAATFLASICFSSCAIRAQTPAESNEAQQEVGGFVPGQKRPPMDPVSIARGKTLYSVSCQGCHGKDLRGGDMGGPNLLRSPVALTDLDGEKIVPVIQGARQSMGMPAIPLSVEDAKAVATYVRSVIALIGPSGTPPSEQKPVDIVVGNAEEGAAYFRKSCQSCHSPEGDLHGIASRVDSPKALQNLWVAGGTRRRKTRESIATVAVTIPSGDTVDGRLVRADDFFVTLKTKDGTTRTFVRQHSSTKIVITDPLQAHKDLLPVYTDKDIHDVTAYLVTLK